jgi:hypothetical protein
MTAGLNRQWQKAMGTQAGGAFAIGNPRWNRADLRARVT